jgi:hypothetical protein
MFYLSWIDLHKASLPEDAAALDEVPDIQSPEPNTVDETRPGYADLHARLGSLRGLMFTKAEVQLPC